MLLAFIPGVGPPEMILIVIVGVLLFGSRLPEVGKSLGKGIAQFKKGMQGVEDELHSITHSSAPPRRSPTAKAGPSEPHAPPSEPNDLAPDPKVPKFEPPTTAPVARSSATEAVSESSELHD